MIITRPEINIRNFGKLRVFADVGHERVGQLLFGVLEVFAGDDALFSLELDVLSRSVEVDQFPVEVQVYVDLAETVSFFFELLRAPETFDVGLIHFV